MPTLIASNLSPEDFEALKASQAQVGKSIDLNGDDANEVLRVLDNKAFSWFHIKMIVISGMGFFTDAYDLFCIGLLTKLLGRIYYQDDPYVVMGDVKPGVLPINIDIAISSVALCGTLAGQLFFGALGDRFGRKVCAFYFCLSQILDA